MFHLSKLTRPLLFLIILLSIFTSKSFPQVFVKITDTSNPLVTEVFTGKYFGASWVDIDNDGWLDLFINRKPVFKNLGNGNFVKLTSAMGDQTPNLGHTWADFNNDGFIDCYVVATGATNSFLYKNEGNGVINKIRTGVIGDSAYNTGWGCAWADYDNDGFTDLVISAANNFGIVHHPNRFYRNSGDGTFARLEIHGITDTLAPFTIPTWADYDQDGDMDLFIGSGPGGSTAVDNLYKNLLVENGTAELVRLLTPPLATDLVDGQNWNWIDYDNDTDLDAFLTNYAGGTPNNLYRNNNGSYERMTASQVGNIVSDPGLDLANLWGDFDNDGDLDCFVTRDGGGLSDYYRNNGNGTFTSLDTLAVVTQSGGNFGATAGDYDKNGTLDLYVTGSTFSNGLFRNDLNNGNKWVNIQCVGGAPVTYLSNKSAIGTKVKAKATINGTPVWQYREVLAQNSFNCANMLNVHIGFGNASVIDSLIIIWPRGLKEVFTNVQLNNFYIANEGQGIVSGIGDPVNIKPEGFQLHQNYPNPFNPSTVIRYELASSSEIKIEIFNSQGKEVSTLVSEKKPAGSYEVTFDAEGLSSGIYFYKLSAGNFSETKKMILVR